MHEIYELKEMLCRKLEEYARKGDVTSSSLEVIDKLAHAVKNLGKIIEMYEEEEDGYSSAGEGNRTRMSYAGGGGRYSRENRGGGGNAYARGGNRGGGGRGRNARRDSMGRYSSTGVDSVSEMAMTLGEVMEELPEELKSDAERFMRKLEEMM